MSWHKTRLKHSPNLLVITQKIPKKDREPYHSFSNNWFTKRQCHLKLFKNLLLDRRGQQELGLNIVHCFILCLSPIMDCLGEDGRRMDLKKKCILKEKLNLAEDSTNGKSAKRECPEISKFLKILLKLNF